MNWHTFTIHCVLGIEGQFGWRCKNDGDVNTAADMKEEENEEMKIAQL